MQTALLDPRNDVVFKKLFAKSLGLLTHLINAMRPGQPTITVVKEQDQALWCFELRDKARPHVRLGDEMAIIVIELPKADRLMPSGRLSAQPGQEALPFSEFGAWITLFLHWNEETIMSQIDYPPVQQAMERLKELSADEEEVRRLAKARDLAMFMDRLETEAAEERGEQRGFNNGLEDAVKRLMAKGNTEAQARAMLGL